MLGFDGVVVSDALEMRGFDDARAGATIDRALLAGIDLFLVARRPDLAAGVRESLTRAASTDARARERARAAIEAVERLAGARPMPGVSEDPARAGAEAAAFLEELHDRATHVAPGRLEDVGAVVCPAMSIPRHLDPLDVEETLCGGDPTRRFLEIGAARSLEEGMLPDRGRVLAVGLARGGVERALAPETIRVLARWAEGRDGRAVTLLCTADHHRPDGVPAKWALQTLTGSHRSSFAALARRLGAAQ
jgi:hypothetical protein